MSNIIVEIKKKKTLTEVEVENAALEAALKEVRDNMSARAVCAFHDGSYAVSGDTITMLVLEKRELQAENAALRKAAQAVVDTSLDMGSPHHWVREDKLEALATALQESSDNG